MSIQFKQANSVWHVLLDGEQVLTIAVPEGCTDSFEPIGNTAFYWHRKTTTPVTKMRLTSRQIIPLAIFRYPASTTTATVGAAVRSTTAMAKRVSLGPTHGTGYPSPLALIPSPTNSL